MKKQILLVAVPIALLIVALLGFSHDGFVSLVFAAYGNDLKYIEVWEGNTLKANFTSSGGTVRVNASNTITFNVSICINSTLVSSSAEAVSYTAVYMNITGIWTNMELNNTSVVLNGSFYYLIEKGVLNAGTLSEGQTYDCSVLYKAYY